MRHLPYELNVTSFHVEHFHAYFSCNVMKSFPGSVHFELQLLLQSHVNAGLLLLLLLLQRLHSV